MVKDAGVKWVLSRGSGASSEGRREEGEGVREEERERWGSGVQEIRMDDEGVKEELRKRKKSNVGVKVSGGNSAYVIYTSGTTGKAKGVEVTHGGVVNTLVEGWKVGGLEKGEGMAALASVAFDISVVEVGMVWKVHEGERPHIVDRMINREVTLVINTPLGRRAFYDDTYIRKYALQLGISGNRLVFDIRLADNTPVIAHMLSLAPFRRVVKDYFVVCDSYYTAIRTATPDRIEALDMARRSLHDEGSGLVMERLKRKVDLDFDTARRLFTLISVLHWKG